MSAPSGGAASAPQCACTNISIMQLFHELKQQFPGVPDHVVSTTISSHCHDRSACQLRLQCEARKYLSHLYPSSSLSGANKESKHILCPQQCPNQLIIAKEAIKPKPLQVSSVVAQKAISSYTKLDENQNENIVKEEEQTDSEEDTSGSAEYKLSEVIACKQSVEQSLLEDVNSNNCSVTDSKTFQIIKSNKVTSGLNEKLFDHSGKHEVGKDEKDCTSEKNNESNKLRRPTTLDLSPEPQIAGFDLKTNKESLSAPATFPDTSPKLQNKSDCEACKCQHRCDKSNDGQKREDATNVSPHASSEPFPVNLSVNLNCLMDVRPGGRPHHSHFQEPWQGSYSSPANITSVNLTVCTPTGVPEDKRNTLSGSGNPSDPRQRGFEGHVQITVSPASAQPPPFRGPSSNQPRPYYSPLSNIMPESPSSSLDNLIRRQKARLQRLQNALAGERNRLMSMQREVSLLQGPPPNNAARLWPDVQHLRKLCQKLTRELDRFTADTDGEFYDNLYTGQQQTGIPRHHHRQHHHETDPDSSWQCHMCTFRNNAFLNKCEQCDMPRIILVHADEEIRVEVTPGQSKVMRSRII